MVCIFLCVFQKYKFSLSACHSKKPQANTLSARTIEKKLFTWLPNALAIEIEHHSYLKMKNCKGKNRLASFVLIFQQTMIIPLRSTGVSLRLL